MTEVGVIIALGIIVMGIAAIIRLKHTQKLLADVQITQKEIQRRFLAINSGVMSVDEVRDQDLAPYRFFVGEYPSAEWSYQNPPAWTKQTQKKPPELLAVKTKRMISLDD